MSKFRLNNVTSAKLTPEQVLSIRERFANGETQGALARAFGVSVGQVGRITRGEAWQAFTQVMSESEIMARNAQAGVRPSQSEEEITRMAEESLRRFQAMQTPLTAEPPNERALGYGAEATGVGLERLKEEASKLVAEVNVDELLNDFTKETP